MRRRDDDNGSAAFWIVVTLFLFGMMLLMDGESKSDVGAGMCPRSSHFCVEPQ